MNSTHEQYEAPKVSTLGTVASLTLGGKVGTALDATFPAGTPLGKLTLS